MNSAYTHASKLLQSCLTLCNAMDYSPPGSCPWDSPGKDTGVGFHVLLQGIFPTQGSKGSNCISHIYCIGRWVLYHQCATWEAPDGWYVLYQLSHKGSPGWYVLKSNTEE